MFPHPLPNSNADELTQASLEEISRNIREHGIQLVAVYDSEHDEYPPFLYTIGLQDRGIPELIAFGDDEEKLNSVGVLFQRLARRERPLVAGEKLREGARTLVAAIPDPDFDRFLQEHCLIEAQLFYGTDRVEVLVLVEEAELENAADMH